MPDRSSHQDLPEDWNHGSHAARGPFSTAGASDGYGAGPTGPHRARTTDGYGTGPTDAFGAAGAAGAAKSDPLGARADSYGAGNTDAFGIRPASMYGAGAADPFGDADPFGPRATDPFGPPVTGAFGTKTAAFAAVTSAPATARPDAERPTASIGDQALGAVADSRSFLGALFDFGFTSFMTPKVIKVLYILLVIGTVASALVFTIIAFRASTAIGLLTLVFGDPLFIFIVLAFYRIILEFFVVTFRVADDIRALRERGD
jgi:hypothetical protein